MKQLNNKNVVLIVLIFLAVVIGVFAVRTSRLSLDTSPDASSWQLLEAPAGKDYYYQLKYPNTWSKKTFEDTPANFGQVTFYSQAGSFIMISVKELSKPEQDSLAIIDNHKQYLKEVTETTVEVDGLEGVKLEAQEKGNPYIEEGTPKTILYVQKGNLLYILSGTFKELQTKEIYELVVQSLKLT